MESGIFLSRSCWKQFLVSSVRAGQIHIECSVKDPSVLGSSDQSKGVRWMLPGLVLETMWKKIRLNHKFIGKDAHNVACIYYLSTCTVTLHVLCKKCCLDLKNKSSPTRENWSGKISALSLSTKQWFQMWKRPEKCWDFLSNLTRGKFAASILGVFGMPLASLQPKVPPNFDQCDVFERSIGNNHI